jgi:hypothetical protein
MAEWLALMLHVQKILGLNLDPKFGYSEVVHGFPQCTRHTGIVP